MVMIPNEMVESIERNCSISPELELAGVSAGPVSLGLDACERRKAIRETMPGDLGCRGSAHSHSATVLSELAVKKDGFDQ